MLYLSLSYRCTSEAGYSDAKGSFWISSIDYTSEHFVRGLYKC